MKGKKGKQIIFLTLVLMMILGLGCTKIAAAETYNDIILTGEYENISVIETGDTLFAVSDILPGDVWNTGLTFKNNYAKTMEIVLIEVRNNIDEELLYNGLDIQIIQDDKVLYDGKYCDIDKNMKNHIFRVDPHDSQDIKIITSFPSEYGNKYQNSVMDSTWVFEVKAEEAKRENPDTGDTSNYFLYLSLFMISGISCLYIYNRKRRI